MKHTVWILAALFAVPSCGGDTQGPLPADAIDRETFIETFVDLRVAAIAEPDFRITPDRRAELLAAHGVSSDDLLAFVDAHGRDLDFMNAVWIEVETRFGERVDSGEGR